MLVVPLYTPVALLVAPLMVAFAVSEEDHVTLPDAGTAQSLETSRQNHAVRVALR